MAPPVPVVSAPDIVEGLAVPELAPASLLLVPQPPSSVVPSTTAANNKEVFFMKRVVLEWKETEVQEISLGYTGEYRLATDVKTRIFQR